MLAEDAQGFVWAGRKPGSSTSADTGFDLAISQRLVVFMHGTHSEHAVPGAGSTFTVCLPAAD